MLLPPSTRRIFINSPQVVKDRESGASKRFAFVQFEEDADAKTAMKELGEPVVSTLKAMQHVHNNLTTRVYVDVSPFGRSRERVVPCDVPGQRW